MTTIAAEPIEAVDLSDLDLLDDEVRHACCLVCYPLGSLQALEVFTTLCGKRSWARGIFRHLQPGDCSACAARATHPCSRCGR